VSNNSTKSDAWICFTCNTLCDPHLVRFAMFTNFPKPLVARVSQPIVAVTDARTNHARTVASLHEIEVNTDNLAHAEAGGVFVNERAHSAESDDSDSCIRKIMLTTFAKHQ